MQGQKIAYLRVSTSEQNEQRQLDGVQVDKTFIDKCSGKDTNRPQLQLALEFLREGDTLVIHSMDRLARNLSDLRKIVEDLTARSVEVQFLKESLTFHGKDGAMANLMLNIMGAFAEFERSLIRERQKEGIALARARGVYKGRKAKLTNTQVLEIKDRIANGDKKTVIAKDYGVSRETLYKYLRAS